MKKDRLRIALAQVNTTVGDIDRNTGKIIESIDRAKNRGADIVVFPELALSGYPPEDLLLKKNFLKKNRDSLNKIRNASRSIFVIVGFPDLAKGEVSNAAALIYDRKLLDIYRKMILPNYGVFDERRYFYPGESIPVAPFGKGIKMSVSICEDIWHPLGPHRIAVLCGGANLIINLSSSPYHAGKIKERQRILKDCAIKNKAFVCYCNSIGGQDELVFDGGSLIYGPKGHLIARARQFEEGLLIADLDFKSPRNIAGKIEKLLDPTEEIYSALVLGLKDYTHKNDFKKVVLGLSGGIDSALTAVIACDALGKKNVVAVSMPSRFSSFATKRDARILARNLEIELIDLPIDNIHKAHLSTLKRAFKGKRPGVAEENLQARIRGNILMALSNKFGWLVVTTGNKSEISVGYCTLYGDMAGGFAVLKDVPKTTVYTLARYISKKYSSNTIPLSIIKRAPTAELRARQKDQDTLPPYKTLDSILDAYIEGDSSREDIVRMGFNRALVNQVISMVDKNEYKRRQAPPGVKITPKAFGRDRRMPIVNRWQG
ncbi:MAG: NAD+ synthase [Candidatus Omnitrophota bacterium]